MGPEHRRLWTRWSVLQWALDQWGRTFRLCLVLLAAGGAVWIFARF
jgi:hypothetical protein